ncbi:hypothetical protein [Bradyrhizobium sp. G127]|uniref:hypothetical protein n=1 Tax=Bradyrhizobium sp. G127 TaxID=2904800 RepID=UPI001F211575|nr:hypothetical protein [Bradyrhizobium sp. G127]MCF2523893.1 hypothetical protein [Bradyrhizobium sp. G127]
MLSFESIGRRAAVAVILGLSLVSSQSSAQSGQPFAGMSGVWSGKGSISLEGGAREAIRCRATYAVRNDGNALQQTLRCASDSYKIELTSNVVASGGKLSGTWSEATRNVSGDVEGTTSGGRFQVVVRAGTFSADLALTTRGNSQSVVIRSEGGEFKGANITLTRT